MPSWGELLIEQQPHVNNEGANVPGLNNDQLRDKYLDLLFKKTGRNVIAYYSGWLKPGKSLNVDINDSDVTGFMNAIKGLDCTKGLDLMDIAKGIGRHTVSCAVVNFSVGPYGKILAVARAVVANAEIVAQSHCHVGFN